MPCCAGSTTSPMNLQKRASNELLFHLNVYVAADKYQLPELKRNAMSSFKQIAQWTHGADQIFSVVDFLYQNGVPESDELREIMLVTCRKHLAALLMAPKFRVLVRNYDDLFVRLMQPLAFAAELEERKMTRCGSCQTLREFEKPRCPECSPIRLVSSRRHTSPPTQELHWVQGHRPIYDRLFEVHSGDDSGMGFKKARPAPPLFTMAR